MLLSVAASLPRAPTSRMIGSACPKYSSARRGSPKPRYTAPMLLSVVASLPRSPAAPVQPQCLIVGGQRRGRLPGGLSGPAEVIESAGVLTEGQGQLGQPGHIRKP